MTQSELFLITLLIIFAVPWAVWRLFRTDHWMPLVVVQIIMGVLLGPGVIAGWDPTLYASVFTAPVMNMISAVALWAVCLFVFTAGIELDLSEAWRDRRSSVITASSALIMPLILGVLAGAVLILEPGWQGSKSQTWQFLLGVGMACAVTALPILIVLLERLDLLRSSLGQRVLRYASLDDILIWSVLAIIVMDWQRLGNQATFVVSFAVCAVIIRRVMPRLNSVDRWAVAMIWLVAAAVVSDWAGLHFIVGAFLAGTVLDRSWLGEESVDQLRWAVLLTMMPVFFLNTGLRTSWTLGSYSVLFTAGLLFLAQLVGKHLGVRLAAAYLGWPKDQAQIIAWLLQTKALIEIIFASVLLDKQIITSDMFTALLLMALASTMITVPIVSRLLRNKYVIKEINNGS